MSTNRNWPETVYVTRHRTSDRVANRMENPTTWDRGYALRATDPVGAWSFGRVKEPAEYIIVATRKTDGIDPHTDAPLYRFDWSETHDPLAIEAVTAAGVLDECDDPQPALSPDELVAMVTLLHGIERARKGLVKALSGSDTTRIIKTTEILLRDHAALIDRMGEAAVAACGDAIEGKS